MKKVTAVTLMFIVLFSSCSRQLLISNGSFDNKPLLFNGEYETKDLNYIEVQGKSVFGIPSFSTNNQNNRAQGFVVTFNGVSLNKTTRIAPIMSLIGVSILTQQITQRVVGRETNSSFSDFRLSRVTSYIIGFPVAGALNNVLWSNSALSGATQTLNYRLINENPNVDLFFYPKYDISNKMKLFSQEALIKGRISGAYLIHHEKIDSL